MRILLFGKTGQIGSRLLNTLAPLGEITAPTSREADFTRAETLVDAVQQVRPDLIVNAAAYTAVDDAEHDALAGAINGTAPAILAREAARIGAALVHYSTDYVFDGCKRGPYVEGDAVAPLNEYGQGKALGEQAIADSAAVHLIFRTSWIYSATGKNFLLTVLRLAQAQPELRIVDAQVGCPTSANVVAEATAQALMAALQAASHANAADAIRPYSGVYHVACEGNVSWHGFAAEILAQAHDLGLISDQQLKPVRAITTSEFPRPAKRPTNSVLATDRFRSTFAVHLPHWTHALREVLRELASGAKAVNAGHHRL